MRTLLMVFMVTVFFSAGAWLDATLYKYFVENMLMDYYLVFLSLAVGILIFTSFSGIILGMTLSNRLGLGRGDW